MGHWFFLMQQKEYKTDPIQPKFDNWFLVDLPDLYKLRTWNCSAISANQNENKFMLATWTKNVNQQRIKSSNFDLIEESFHIIFLGVIVHDTYLTFLFYEI